MAYMNKKRRACRPLHAPAAVAALALAFALAGCASLNPDSKTETQVPWNTYEEAQASIDRVVPFKTRREDLTEIGFDPMKNPAVTVLTYSDILQKFNAGAALRPEEYDPGIRQCLLAGKKCSGYSLSVRRVYRERVGNFLLDWMNFRRETDVKGWTFSAIMIMVDDTVVYTLSGGQPNLREYELTRNPLGPLQSFGWVPTWH
jgi:hypothetical protein